MLISVVIPFYNEQENIDELYRRLISIFNKHNNYNFEIIAVNDGSKDDTLNRLKNYKLKDKRIKIVDLSRNFGHQIAISAGISFSKGNAVVILDADLQDPPELIPEFINKWREGFEVVYGIREKRKENIFKKVCYYLFYRILQSISHVNIPLDSGDCCLMDKKVVDILRNIPERNRFIRGIRSWIGYRQVGIRYERGCRYAGQPKYTILKLIKLALDGAISFSHFPLRVSSLLGILISIISFLIGIILIIKRLIYGSLVYGLTSIIVSVLFIGGIQLIAIGIIGEYIGRIYDETKQRPIFIVKEVIE
ncbi:MAG: glycosyltransferase family 2 protein [Candidatus Omnitrophica bacterium]|nr:glycosyltransferase family 2 protein [Candidatus Omnitrophota bacterium]MDD5591905.1 glycosyltransferase family 2 protein [Candidatus Omnitrophota bacterium]